MYEDIYFLNPAKALLVAKEQNRWGPNNYYLQLCYYEGEKIESDLPNLIHLPLENMTEELVYGTYRIPTKIDLGGLDLSQEVKDQLTQSFADSIEQVKIYRNEMNKQYLQKSLQNSPDFNEPLRFFLMASTSTQVMQYVSKNIADTLDSMGFDVLFKLLVGIEDDSSFKEISQYNPHVTININHINNGFLSEDVFNFVWFQDPMPILFNDEAIGVRKRDVIFTYTQHYKDLLEKKGVHVAFETPIPANSDIFYNQNLPRKEGIVFVGSYYDEAEIIRSHNLPYNFAEDFYDFLENTNKVTRQDLQLFFTNHNIHFPDNAQLVSIVQGFVRNKCVRWMCETIEGAEVYGRNFQDKEKIKEHYHYEVQYGKELADIYNRFQYALVPSILVNSQRLSEVSACGCIPVVYDAGGFTVETNRWDEHCLFFSSKEDLKEIVQKKLQPKYSPDEIAQELSYSSIVKKMLQIIQEKLQQ